MKKVITLMLALAVVFSLGVSSSAANKDFVESIDYKDAPDVIKAIIVDRSGRYLDDVEEAELIITPFDAENPDKDDIQKQLKKSYDAVAANGVEGVLSKEDREALKKAGQNASTLVVSDLFDVWYSHEDELDEDRKLQVTFNVVRQLKETDKVSAMFYSDGKWQLIPTDDVAVDENGNVVIEFTKVCPVAIMIEGKPGGTSDSVMLSVWASVAGISLASIVLILVFGFKKKENNA